MASAPLTLNGFLGGQSAPFQPIVAAWQRTVERAPVQAPTACRRWTWRRWALRSDRGVRKRTGRTAQDFCVF
jgi:hypothetical protein